MPNRKNTQSTILQLTPGNVHYISFFLAQFFNRSELIKLLSNNQNKKAMNSDVNNRRGGSVAEERDRILTGMFPDRESTESAYRTLQERGYTTDDINLLMSDDTRKKHFSKGETEIGNKAMEGAGVGSAIGGTVGATIGVIAALGTSVLVPGLGLVIAGPLAAGLAGAGAGGLTGGIIGALVGAGIPEERARLYESGVKKGKVVMGVRPRNEEDAEYFRNQWSSRNAEEIHY